MNVYKLVDIETYNFVYKNHKLGELGKIVDFLPINEKRKSINLLVKLKDFVSFDSQGELLVRNSDPIPYSDFTDLVLKTVRGQLGTSQSKLPGEEEWLAVLQEVCARKKHNMEKIQVFKTFKKTFPHISLV
jgi:hypothetical protein